MDMSKVQARRMVLVSCFALAIISVYRGRQGDSQQGTFKRLWATGIVAFMLSLLADFAPAVAGPFAALTVLGWFLKDGTGLIDQALGGAGSGTVGSKSQTTTTRTGPSTQTTVTHRGNTTTVAHQTGP